LEAAFVQTAHAMIDYMYKREAVEEIFSKELEVKGNERVEFKNYAKSTFVFR
jgi:hypothetical protein